MALYKRGKYWWYEFRFNGERIRDSTKTSNIRIAQKIEGKRKTDLALGEVGLRPKVKAPDLSAFAARFTAHIEIECGEKPSTVTFYKEKLRRILEQEWLASLSLDQIDSSVIAEYKQVRKRSKSNHGKPFKNSSINRELATLRRLLNIAVELGELTAAPKIELLSGEHEREFVVSDDLERQYLAAASPDLKDMAILLLDTGLRMREYLKLESGDVHLTASINSPSGYLSVRKANTKNSKRRTVPLTARAAEVLKRRKPRTGGLIFRNSAGKPLSQTWLNQQHAALRATLGISDPDFVPHSFRHTYGTRLGESGADVFTIMRLMGHATLAMAQRYVHPTDEMKGLAVTRLDERNRVARSKNSPQISPQKPEEGRAKTELNAL